MVVVILGLDDSARGGRHCFRDGFGHGHGFGFGLFALSPRMAHAPPLAHLHHEQHRR